MTDPVTLLLAGAAGAVVGGVLTGRRGERGDGRASSGTGLECALMVFSVDGLGALRSEHGEDAALRLQERVAGILRRAAPPGARFEHHARTGEVHLTVPDIPFPAAGGLAESARRLASLATVEVGDRRVGRTVSAAVVALGLDREASLAEAARLIDEARAHGGNLCMTAGDAAGATERADVLAAIRAGQVDYHVQPIHDLEAGRVAGFEALIRWTVGGRTVLTPQQFLHRLDWLPDDALDRLVDLAVAAAEPFVRLRDPVYVSLNVTADALERPGGPAGRWLAGVADRLPPDRLVLELLESAVFARTPAVLDGLAPLRARGVRLALDDFGTGLSNFDRLVTFRPDLVKIDRAFVAAPPGDGDGGPRRGTVQASREAVVDALVGLAGRLGMDLVAEGLEREADVAAVRRLGIRHGQGFGIGRPEPAPVWAARLA